MKQVSFEWQVPCYHVVNMEHLNNWTELSKVVINEAHLCWNNWSIHVCQPVSPLMNLSLSRSAFQRKPPPFRHSVNDWLTSAAGHSGWPTARIIGCQNIATTLASGVLNLDRKTPVMHHGGHRPPVFNVKPEKLCSLQTERFAQTSAYWKAAKPNQLPW